jgi:N-formylglutamate deformylase
MSKPFFKYNLGEGPLIVTAIHNGNYIREELMPYLAIDEKSRLYEEDPYTGFFTDIAETSLLGMHSRFEIDLNRDKNGAIYKRPEQAWGLKVWKKLPPPDLLKKSYQYYDDFYKQAEAIINNKIVKYGFAIIYDIHSYNYKRDGIEAPIIDNPDINIGTNKLERKFWGSVVDGLIDNLITFKCKGKLLDVRENIKFKGGHFSSWINSNFDNKACALAIEFKKIFMDEHTNEVDTKVLSELKKALEETIPDVVNNGAKLFGAQVTGTMRL